MPHLFPSLFQNCHGVPCDLLSPVSSSISDRSPSRPLEWKDFVAASLMDYSSSSELFSLKKNGLFYWFNGNGGRRWTSLSSFYVRKGSFVYWETSRTGYFLGQWYVNQTI
jgi:hypothetical protein